VYSYREGFLETLTVDVGNICDNPAEPKFRRIKKENKAFVGRILSCGECGTNFLTACGFKDDGGEFLVCQAAEGTCRCTRQHVSPAVRLEIIGDPHGRSTVAAHINFMGIHSGSPLWMTDYLQLHPNSLCCYANAD
jgi:hypothetical protein